MVFIFYLFRRFALLQLHLNYLARVIARNPQLDIASIRTGGLYSNLTNCSAAIDNLAEVIRPIACIIGSRLENHRVELPVPRHRNPRPESGTA